MQACNDIPSPQEYAELRQQIQTVSANIASGGRYAAQLTILLGEMTALEDPAALRISSEPGF